MPVAPKILFLYTRDERDRSEEVMDYLHESLGTTVILNSISDVLTDNSTLEDELFQSACVVLVSSDQSDLCIKEEGLEIEEEWVTFDGAVIKACLSEEYILNRMVLVHFASKPEKWISQRFSHRVFAMPDRVTEIRDTRDRARLDEFVNVVNTMVANGRMKRL